MIQRLECFLSGYVQGVMFRDFVKRQASKCGLVGEVENMPDGTVRVVAEGEEAELKDFLALLEVGPKGARVGKVAFSWTDPRNNFEDFKIVYRNFLDRF